MSKLRMGIVGVGGIAVGRHIPTFQQMNDSVEMTAVYDVNEERAAQVAKDFGIPNVVAELEAMFPHVDAITICTPNKFHAEFTIAALNAGIHVFCEKPMAMTPEECERMREAEEKSGKVLSIAYHYRFMKEAQAAKNIMQEGVVGNPLVTRVKALRRRKVPGWGVFTNKELQGGGSLIDYGCHLLDLSLWLLGNPKPVEVLGRVYNSVSRKLNLLNEWGEIDAESFSVDDHVTAFITFEDGSSLQFETSWAANIPDDEESISISGDLGGMDVFPVRIYKPSHGVWTNSDVTWMSGEENPSVPQARNFVETCLGSAEQVVKSEEAATVSSIIDAIYRSHEQGTSIKL